MTENLPAERSAPDVRAQLENMEGQFKAALPPHIPVERFTRVVMTAVNGNPDLLAADKRTLFEAAMKAAQDGLLPDGRDGAFVIFNQKVKGQNGERERWLKKVQWMPMIGGILKKVRNSGELVTISAYVAYTKDRFVYVLGDDEKIEHEPSLEEDRGRPRLVYAIAKTKDGGIYREVMTIAEVEKVRNVSRAKDSGPWRDWWDEMAKKTVLRRLAKRLPTSADLDDLIRRDDDLYDFKGRRDEAAPALPTVRNPLQDKLPAAGDGAAIEHDAETGEAAEDGDAERAAGDRNEALPEGASERDDAPQGRDGGQEGQDGRQEPPREKEATKPAAAARPAQAASAGPRKAWDDEQDYADWFLDVIDKARSPSAIRDEWSRTREDRKEIVGTEALERLERTKNAAVEKLKGGA